MNQPGGFGETLKRLSGDKGKSAVAAIVGVAIGASAVAFAASRGIGYAEPVVGNSERAKIEKVVRDYILANPEIIPQAVKLLQERDLAKVIETHRAAFETPFGSAWAGAADGDVTLVEFFDYACSYCRASNADVERLLAEDKGLKIVWREYPVLGEDSIAAARVSLAAAKQGRFAEFHKQLFASGRPSTAALADAQERAGVDIVQSPALDREIEKNYELARAINASGTPAFVVGDKVLHGAVGYDALKQAVAAARARS